MPFTRHLVLTQVIIASVEDAFNLDGCMLFVDQPLCEQFNFDDVGLLKLVLHIEQNMGCSILPHRLHKRMSIVEMASSLDTPIKQQKCPC